MIGNMKSFFCIGMFLVAGALPLFAQSGVVNDEKGLWEIWKLHTEEQDNSKAVIKACIEFKKKNPNDPLGTVTQGLVGWYLIASGRGDAAERIFTPMVTVKRSNLQKAGAYMAQTWLTRLDLSLKMKPLLEAYFRKNVEYPASLDVFKSMPKEQQPPMHDRWDKPWEYELVGIKGAPKMPKNMKYTISSKMLGSYSDMGKALQMPYASRMNLRAYRKLQSKPGQETIEFSVIEDKALSEADRIGKKKKTKILSMGMNGNGLYLAYYGKKIIILTDGNHWQILPKPANW